MDEILLCDSCSYSANAEAAPLVLPENTSVWTDDTMEKFETPNLKSIEDLSKALKVPASQLVKTFFVKFQNEKDKWKEACLILPGDREVNLIKAKTVVGATGEVIPLTDEEVLKATGASPGSCGPVDLKMPVYMDKALKFLNSFIVGANQDGYHLKNVVPGRDFKIEDETDLSQVGAGDPCPECGKKLKLSRGIEVGHIFYLGQKYSKSMNLNYLDDSGKSQFVEMGCYGIGVTRTIQAIIEQNHDENGICWPTSIAPFHVHICLLDPEDEGLSQWVEVYKNSMQKMGFEVFIDDRKERPGIKFKDADLLGFPLRVVAGKRSFENDEVELFVRSTQNKLKFPLDQALSESKKILEGLGE
jgi:prolyl-tRNA synthetase